jgi:hypothetical protein
MKGPLHYAIVKLWRIQIKPPRQKSLLSYIDSLRHFGKLRAGWSKKPRWGQWTPSSPLPSRRPGGPLNPLYNTYWGPLPGKPLRPGIDHPPLSIAEVKEIIHLYLYNLQCFLWHVMAWPLPLPLNMCMIRKVSQTTAVMNIEMRSTRGTWAAKENKVCPRR